MTATVSNTTDESIGSGGSTDTKVTEDLSIALAAFTIVNLGEGAGESPCCVAEAV